MLFLLLLIIIVLLIFLSNNIYLQISNIIKTCAINDSNNILNLDNICNNNVNDISSTFYTCFIEKVNKLDKEKNSLSVILEYIRNIPSGQISIFKKITGIDSLIKVKGIICGLVENNLIDKEALIKEVIAESEIDAEIN